MLHEDGKRLPTLKEYSSLLLPFSVSEDNETINNYGAVTTGKEDEFYLIKTSDYTYRMMPGPEFSPRLYRGQTQHHSPCKPSLFRGKCNYEDYIYWKLKYVELSKLLFYHPAVRDILSWDFDGLEFGIDFQAIAQHYEYPTQMLDLTRSFDIAMFFATHKFDAINKSFQPTLGETAVLYVIDIAKLIQSLPEDSQLIPVGLDPLPRSSVQRAFGLELNMNDDFENIPGVHFETFYVTQDIATYYSNKYNNIYEIFPNDAFEKYIYFLKNNQTITRKTIEYAEELGIIPSNYSTKFIEYLLLNGGYYVSDEKIDIPSKHTINSAEKEWRSRRDKFIHQIKWRGVASSI